jgi:hypothetical protein
MQRANIFFMTTIISEINVIGYFVKQSFLLS